MEIITAWLREWGTLTVAGLALAQPWLIAAYRKFFRRPQIQVYPIGNVEIGYSELGATIGLHGSLVVWGREVFVHSVDLDVVRKKDNATHHFTWALFRGFRAKASELHDIEMELAAGFVLKPGQPKRYNILFQDIDLSTEVRSALEELQRAWGDYIVEREDEEDSFGQPISVDALYEDFSSKSVNSETWSSLDRLRYWEPGSYSLTMRVNTSNPEGSYEFGWEFEISETQEALVKLNSVEMIRAACDRGSGTYRFAYAAYDRGALPTAL